jgi:hypothetical protein
MWVMWNLVSVSLETMLVSVQDRFVLCAEHTTGSEIILDIPDGTNRWGVSCGISYRSVWRQSYCWFKIGASLAPNIPYAQNSFWTNAMVHLVDEAQVEACFGLFGGSANWRKNGPWFALNVPQAQKIVLDAPDGTPRWQGPSGTLFRSVWRSANLDAR